MVAALISHIDGNIDELIYFKDVEGVYRRFGEDNSVIDRMSLAEAKRFDFKGLLDKRSLYFAGCRIRIQSYEKLLGNGTLIFK